MCVVAKANIEKATFCDIQKDINTFVKIIENNPK